MNANYSETRFSTAELHSAPPTWSRQEIMTLVFGIFALGHYVLSAVEFWAANRVRRCKVPRNHSCAVLTIVQLEALKRASSY
jgi:hypothetical protein